jgi:hypothetical protein
VTPATLRRVRRLVLLPLFAAIGLTSCGGGGESGDAERLLDRAFSEEIKSADLKADVRLQLEGSPSLDRPVRIEASGPFRTNEGKLPSVDLDLRIGTDGGGQTVTTGFLSTGDRAFVKFQDVYYEQPASEVRRTNRAIADNQGRRGSLRSLGLDPRSWLSEAKEEGDEEVAGVAVRHVSGTLDVDAVMRNLNTFVRRSASAIGGATGQRPPDPLSKEDIRRVGEVVKDPSFDVYVGKRDGIIRRVSGRIEFDVPEDRRTELGGIEGGTIEFSAEFSDVNGDQQIDAPARARPLSALTRSLGGAGALGGLGAGGAERRDGSGAGEPQGTPPGSGDGTGTTPEAEDFREYADCLDKARPEDTEALQRCADLLQRP